MKKGFLLLSGVFFLGSISASDYLKDREVFGSVSPKQNKEMVDNLKENGEKNIGTSLKKTKTLLDRTLTDGTGHNSLDNLVTTFNTANDQTGTPRPVNNQVDAVANSSPEKQLTTLLQYLYERFEVGIVTVDTLGIGVNIPSSLLGDNTQVNGRSFRSVRDVVAYLNQKNITAP